MCVDSIDCALKINSEGCKAAILEDKLSYIFIDYELTEEIISSITSQFDRATAKTEI